MSDTEQEGNQGRQQLIMLVVREEDKQTPIACPSRLQIPFSDFPSGDFTKPLTIQFWSRISPSPIAVWYTHSI